MVDPEEKFLIKLEISFWKLPFIKFVARGEMGQGTLPSSFAPLIDLPVKGEPKTYGFLYG